jgi:hypothetical protein
MSLIEQIRCAVVSAINPKISPIENIILNSQYHCLAYAGQAGQVVPVNIPASFNQQIFSNKNLLIKSIKLIPYAWENTIDLSLSDGTTETVPPNMRLQRTMERFSASVDIRLLINGAVVNVFSIDAGGNNWFPLDLSVDNIYYNYKSKVQTVGFEVAALNFVNWANTGAQGLNVVVLLECYTY